MIFQSLRGLLVLFLFSPFLFLFSFFYQPGGSIDWGEIAWAAKNSFYQSFFSATFALLLGMWGAKGILLFSASETRRYWRAIIEIALLLPNFLPTLFTLIACLNVFDPFPMGRAGIVIVHTFLNWGLVAVLLVQLYESKLGGMAEWALVSGASRIRFFTRVALPVLWRDMLLIWVFVFAVSFESFAVPLAVGGGSGTTLEVLIYEKIRLSTDWSQALIVALLQSLTIAAIGWIAVRGTLRARGPEANLSILKSRTGALLLMVMVSVFFVGYFQGVPVGLQRMSDLFELRESLAWSTIGSLVIGLLTGALCFGFLLFIAFLGPSSWFDRFMSAYSAPSQALSAFTFLVLLPNGGAWPFVKIPLCLTLLTLSTLWRMGWKSQMDSLRLQQQSAAVLGAKPGAIFRSIILPQMADPAARLAGVASLWAVGDFAISRIIAHRDLSLAMMTETLMSGYRLGLATIMTLAVLAVGAICFFIMRGVGNVIGRKPLPFVR